MCFESVVASLLRKVRARARARMYVCLLPIARFPPTTTAHYHAPTVDRDIHGYCSYCYQFEIGMNAEMKCHFYSCFVFIA